MVLQLEIRIMKTAEYLLEQGAPFRPVITRTGTRDRARPRSARGISDFPMF